nr:MAG TPA: hypothetical protein [Caudoviricetes sp.]
MSFKETPTLLKPTFQSNLYFTVSLLRVKICNVLQSLYTF